VGGRERGNAGLLVISYMEKEEGTILPYGTTVFGAERLVTK